MQVILNELIILEMVIIKKELGGWFGSTNQKTYLVVKHKPCEQHI